MAFLWDKYAVIHVRTGVHLGSVQQSLKVFRNRHDHALCQNDVDIHISLYISIPCVLNQVY